MSAYTEADLHRAMSQAWNEGWRAGLHDSRNVGAGVTEDPYAKTEKDRSTLAKESAAASETEPLDKERS